MNVDLFDIMIGSVEGCGPKERRQYKTVTITRKVGWTPGVRALFPEPLAVISWI